MADNQGWRIIESGVYWRVDENWGWRIIKDYVFYSAICSFRNKYHVEKPESPWWRQQLFKANPTKQWNLDFRHKLIPSYTTTSATKYIQPTLEAPTSGGYWNYSAIVIITQTSVTPSIVARGNLVSDHEWHFFMLKIQKIIFELRENSCRKRHTAKC